MKKYYISKETIILKDFNGNCFLVYKENVMTLEGEHYYKMGRKHTVESKKKIAEKNKKNQLENSSQKGTYWIMNIKLKKNKKIKGENLFLWIEKGWIKGRKMKW